MNDPRKLLIAALAFVTFPVGQPLQGGQNRRLPTNGDIVVATIRQVSEHRPSNGNPPRVELEVHEVLRGAPSTPRRAAMWAPPPHDVDYVGGNSEKRLQQWRSQPMAAPEVGSKWILWGELSTPPGVFVAWDEPRLRYSAEARRQAMAMIRDAEQWAQRRHAEIAADQKARTEAQTKWRARVTARDIERYCDEADFVAIGTYSGGFVGSGRLYFRVTDVVKGVKRDWRDMLGDSSKHGPTTSPYATWVTVSQEVNRLLDHGSRYLLFLTERDLVVADGEAIYQRVAHGDGVVLADRVATEAAREAARKTPGKPALPALVAGFGEDERLFTVFQRAADKRFVVLRLSVYVMNFIPAADPGPIAPGGHALVAYRVGQGQKQLVFQGDCDPKSDKELAQTAEEIVRRLLDAKIGVGAELGRH